MGPGQTCTRIYLYWLSILDVSHSFCLQRLEEHITKNSPSLGRDAIYKKSVSTLCRMSPLELNHSKAKGRGNRVLY